ncbi:MAG: competence protein ComEC [Actinomycetota bacterium]|nr:competence protein ComEC [Actinomycetota bacterium]
MTPPPPRGGPLRSELGAILAAGAVLLGARAGEHLPWAVAAVPAGAMVFGLPLALLLQARGRGPVRRVAGLVCLAALGAVSMARAVAGLDGAPARLARAGDEGVVTVRLAADPQGRWTGALVPARLERFDRGAASEMADHGPVRSDGVAGGAARGMVLVVARGAAAARVRLLEAGESAVLLGRFRDLEGAERRWRWRHAGAVFEADDLVGAGRASPALFRVANGLRHRVLSGGDGLGETDRALVAGFLVGDDRDLPPAVAADFRAAGLSHLLVVSGANVTLALALVAPLLRRTGLVGRLAGGLAVLVVFCAMTRFEPSVLRAGVMSGLAVLAAFLGRPVNGLRLLALAVTGLVLVDPFLLHSLGFGLSCGASAGILLLAGPLARRLPGPRLVREPLAVTAAALVGVAPVALPAFGHLPRAALPATRAAAPAAAALSLWGLGSGLVGGMVGAGAGSAGGGPAAVLQGPTAVLAWWIRLVAHLAARCPVMIGARPGALAAVAGLAWWRFHGPGPAGSGAGADPVLLPDGRGSRREVDFEADGVIDGEEAGPGDQEGGADHGVEQVEFEAAALAGRAERAEVPLHLGHDEEHLQRDEAAPHPGQ